MTQRSLACLVGAVLVGTGLSSAAPGWPQTPPAPGWLPPDLSKEERQEWKDGRPPGWSRGLKRGWRGKDCPPGLAKKGRCHPREIAARPPAEQRKWEEQLRETLERLKKIGREKLNLPAPILDAMLFSLEAAARHGVPIDSGERVVTVAAEQRLSPYGIEAITRALAYGAERGVPAAELETFAREGLSQGIAPESIALGLYRVAAPEKR